ncbi:hypothetical protein [Neorhizobium tomejilense]|nr:hypothetical protein [Neorhizobium tomejilense]
MIVVLRSIANEGMSARSQLAVFDQRKGALEVASGAGQLEDFKRHAPRC